MLHYLLLQNLAIHVYECKSTISRSKQICEHKLTHMKMSVYLGIFLHKKEKKIKVIFRHEGLLGSLSTHLLRSSWLDLRKGVAVLLSHGKLLVICISRLILTSVGPRTLRQHGVCTLAHHEKSCLISRHLCHLEWQVQVAMRKRSVVETSYCNSHLSLLSHDRLSRVWWDCKQLTYVAPSRLRPERTKTTNKQDNGTTGLVSLVRDHET